MPSQSLTEQFPFHSRDFVWRQLRDLVTAVEARLQGAEKQAASYEDEIALFEAMGLAAVNQALTPLVEQALDRLTTAQGIFSAQSSTSFTLAEGATTFIIPGDDRLTFVPLTWVSIYANGLPSGYAGCIARVVSWDYQTGELAVDVVSLDGTGTYADWTISTSPPISLGSVTMGQVDAAISAAVDTLDADLQGQITTLGSTKAALASPAFSGTPTAPSPASEDDSTKISTTAWARVMAAAVVQQALATLDIPGPASVAQVRQAASGDVFIEPSHITGAAASVGLTDAATIAVDWAAGINFTVTLGGNRTLGNPTNGQPGTWRTVLVSQDSNGTRTLAFGNQYVFPGGVAPGIASGNGALTRLTIFCRTSSIFECYGVGIGLAAAA